MLTALYAPLTNYDACNTFIICVVHHVPDSDEAVIVTPQSSRIYRLSMDEWRPVDHFVFVTPDTTETSKIIQGLRAGNVEVRTVTRRQISVDGIAVGDDQNRRADAMTRSLIATAALCVSTAIATATPANTQCPECSSGILSSTLQGQGDYARGTERVRSETARDIARYRRGFSRTSSSSRASAPSPDIMDRTQSVSFSVLNAEFSRRANAYGKGSAQQWLNGAERRR